MLRTGFSTPQRGLENLTRTTSAPTWARARKRDAKKREGIPCSSAGTEERRGEGQKQSLGLEMRGLES